MNNSQGNNSEIPKTSLGTWMKELAAYAPIECEKCERALIGNGTLTIRLPAALKISVSARAKMLGLNRSHYIRLLVDADIAN